MSKHNIVFFIFVFLLVSCQGTGKLETVPGEIRPILNESPSSVATISTPATPMNLTPATSVAALATAIPTKAGMATSTPTQTIPSEARLRFRCLDVASKLTPNTVSSGDVILDSRVIIDGRYQRSTFRLDMATDKTTSINEQDEGGIDYSISPDRKLLTYHSSTFNADGKRLKEELVIVATGGQRLKTIPWEKGWSRIVGWIDNQRLVINSYQRQESLIKMFATFLVFNPFNGKRQFLYPNFPEIYNESDMPDWWDHWSMTVYDPTLTRVVYLQSPEVNRYALTLWDLEKRKPLLSLEPYAFRSSPRWSPDGSQLVVEYYNFDRHTDELILIRRDGQFEQLTNLNAYLKVSFLSYSWSPDGRYIAAWLVPPTLDSDVEAELVIVDTVTRQVTDNCIRVKYGGEEYGSGRPLAPIWSPDGTQLIVQDWYEKYHRRVILVDPAKGFAAQIAQDMEPMGWMLAP